MLLKEIMTPDVEVIDVGTTLKQAAEKMRTLDVGVLPVVSKDDIEGVVTDRDIVIRGVADDLNPNTSVNAVMTEKALSMPADTSIEDAKASMEQQQIRRLLVVDENKAVIGIVSLGDLAVRADQDTGGEVLQKVSDPTQPDRKSPAHA